MPEYKCDDCERVFKQKGHLEYHILNNACKKFSHFCKLCGKGFTTPSSMYRHVRQNCAVKRDNDNKKTEILEQLVQRETESSKSLNNSSNVEKDNSVCSSNSSANSGTGSNNLILERLVKLEDNNKKLEKENKELKKKIEHDNHELKQEVKTLKKTVKSTTRTVKRINNNTINNTNNTNNTNNGVVINGDITLVGYGQEDLTKLNKTELLRILQQGYYSTLKLTEAVHFNPKYPEFHNIFISNIKDKYAMMFDGKEWTLTTKEDLINKIYDDKKNYIEENLEEFVDSLAPSRKRALERWLETHDDDDKIKEIKENIKLLLYNRRKMIDTLNIGIKQQPPKSKSIKTAKDE